MTRSRGVAIYMPCFQHRLFGCTRALLLLLEVLVRELGGRAAVLDRAGEVDRWLQGGTIHVAVAMPTGTQTVRVGRRAWTG